MQISTKTGDHGQTSLYSGERVSKADLRIELVGALDELNSSLGVVLSSIDLSPDLIKEDELLSKLPHFIFELGSYVANTKLSHGLEPEHLKKIQYILTAIEAEIEGLETELPPLTQFVLPGGSQAAAHLHLARATARRAERFAVQIQDLPKGVLPALNRLSDYLFLRARKLNIDNGNDEVFWEKL